MPKKIFKDTPEPERYARIFAEHVEGQLKLLNENFETIKNDFGKDLKEFKLEVREEFAKVDLRFMGVNQHIDNLRTELKQEIQAVRIELKQEIQQEVQGSEARLADKIDQIGERVAVVEEDVAKIPRSSLS